MITRLTIAIVGDKSDQANRASRFASAPRILGGDASTICINPQIWNFAQRQNPVCRCAGMSRLLDRCQFRVQGFNSRRCVNFIIDELAHNAVDCLTVDDLGVDIKPRLTVVRVEEPAAREAGIKVADVKELVEKLKNEAKVI